jgi:hypothetical protein
MSERQLFHNVIVLISDTLEKKVLISKIYESINTYNTFHLLQNIVEG